MRYMLQTRFMLTDMKIIKPKGMTRVKIMELEALFPMELMELNSEADFICEGTTKCGVVKLTCMSVRSYSA